MEGELWDWMESMGVARCVTFSDRASGLRAFLVLDDLTLGPAAGGIRTWSYTTAHSAFRDAAKLARAMTYKCSLAGLDAGGGKMVVLDHPGLVREQAFAQLGQRVEELQGAFRTAGDLGTSRQDLLTMAQHCQYVHTEEEDLSDAVACGLVHCVKVALEARQISWEGLSVAVQGCGAIGRAAVRALAAQNTGLKLVVADVRTTLAQEVAQEFGASVVDPARILQEEVDLLVPCATGGVITPEVATALQARAVCGAANNIMSSREAEQILCGRDIVWVPDMIASAGAVIDGIGRTVMGLADRTFLLEQLGQTAAQVLLDARAKQRLPSRVAIERAKARIDASRTCAP